MARVNKTFGSPSACVFASASLGEAQGPRRTRRHHRSTVSSSSGGRFSRRMGAERTREQVRSSRSGRLRTRTRNLARLGVLLNERGHVVVSAKRKPSGKRLYLFLKCPGSTCALSKDGSSVCQEGGGAAPAQQVLQGRWRMTR